MSLFILDYPDSLLQGGKTLFILCWPSHRWFAKIRSKNVEKKA